MTVVGAGFANAAPLLVRYASAPAAAQVPSVSGVYALPSHFVKPKDATSTPYKATATAWPKDASASISLPRPAPGARQGAKSAAAGTPVWAQAVADSTGAYTGPGGVAVHVLGQDKARAAGIGGVLLTLSPTGGGTGSARVGVDYSAFAQGYGGNYGSRMTLVQYPECILTTPEAAACRVATRLGAVNDASGRSVSAQVSLTGAGASGASRSSAVVSASGVRTTPESAASSGAVVLAVMASGSSGDGGGSGGTYSATTLKPSGSWSQGGSTGSFDYSIPITVPPAASSLTPSVALNYDSGSVDGQTASTQAQSSWVGDGWSTPSSFVEQSFVSCADSPEGSASPVSTPDACYAGPILTLSLKGATTSLVWDSSKSVWKPQADTGETVTHVTNSSNGTGTYNTDYWVVTERDGTVYQFGRNELPGWSSGKGTTNSVDSEPVYSAHAGDPCYSSSGFTSSVCTMAYRWNLDYVKDLHGNAMAYYYNQDTNYYGEDDGAHNVPYVRDSHVAHIDYGFTDGNAYATVPDSVVFNTGDRCVSGTCDPLNSTTKANWPDVPFDLICASGATCTSYGPGFFSTVRLTSIVTEQYSVASSALVPVDTWALTQTMPATGDSTSATLWLSQVQRTGSDTTAGAAASVTLPPVTFAGIDLQNRVDTVTDGLPALYRYRISSITTETGSVISPTYGQSAACTGPVTLTPSSNTSSCYPVYWTPSGYTAPFLDWFNKYVVTKVTQTDPTGGAAATATSYAYNGGAAWHYDDNEVVQAKYRTYGQFRGYGDVVTYTGDGVNDKRTQAETTYYRGMSNDNNTTAVTLTDSQGGTHDDTNQLAGDTLETTVYLGEGGPVDHSTITSYWVSAATATRTRTGLPALTANRTAPVETYTRQALTDGGTTTWRYTEADTSYDATVTDALFGTAAHTYTHTVPVNSAYDRCTSTAYAPVNASANLVGLAAQVEVDAVACGGFTEGPTASVPASVNALSAPPSVTRPDQVVSDALTFYDDSTFSTTFPQAAAPSTGDITMTRNAVGYTNGAFTYQTTARDTYDSGGRIVVAYDATGNATTTTYTMNAVGLTTGISVKNPLQQTVSTTLDAERALALTATDANGVVTSSQYDALGRATGVWLDSRATSAAANYLYTYAVSNSGPTATTTQQMNEGLGYATTTVIYDGLLRPRQAQSATVKGGRMVTDTFYDTRGWASAKYNGWFDSATTPNTTVTSAAQLGAQVPNEDYYTYDGLGHAVVDASESNGTVVSSVTTVYNGDRTTVIPPAGAVTQATLTDPLGRKTELDQYTVAPTLNTPANTFTGLWSVSGGTVAKTGYGYDAHGNQNTVTDASNNTWTSTFNLLGQVTAKADPDAGNTTGLVYDADGNLLQSTDSRGKTVSTTYDALGRKTGIYDAATSAQGAGNEISSWVYDNANNAVSAMTYPIGHVTTATSYSGGAAYTTQAAGFNVFGEPLGATVTIPSSTEGSVLGTSYTFSHTYSPNIGLLLTDVYPAAGGLSTETDTHGSSVYSGIEVPVTLGTGLTSYANYVTYDAYGRVTQETLGSGTNEAFISDTYDPHTSRLTDQLVTRKTATPANVDEQAYTYDLAGNLTRQTGTRLGSTSTAETQCYQYDTVDRLNAAWTATDNCAAVPTPTSHTTVGDPLAAASAYWSTWSFNPLGQRTQQIDHSTTGGTDTTTGYTYNGNGTGQPNTLTSTASTGGTTASTAYSYDTSGNTTTRTTPAQGSQTLGWDDEGRLSSITGPSTGTGYIYDADGNVLLQKDTGTTTLYLPGEQIALNTATQTTTAVRYAALPGGGTVVRTGTGTNYTFEITADQHGTGTLTLDHTAQTPTWRQFTPYGAPRGTTSTWIDNRGFLNKPVDATTGLTQVGARQYDPAIGQFVSLDPIFESASPQQQNGYTYAGENPVTGSDPTGLRACVDSCNTGSPPPGCPYGTHPDGSCAPPGGGGGTDNCYNSEGDYICGTTTTVVYVSPHVLIHAKDPEARYLQQAWEYALSTWGAVHNTYEESLRWQEICHHMLQVCTGDLIALFGLMGQMDRMTQAAPNDPFASFGALLLTGATGPGTGYVKASNLGDPQSLLGIASSDVASLVNADGFSAAMCNSFTGSTEVVMADGTSKPIGKIKIGDKVANNTPGADPGTKEQIHVVTAVHITHTDRDYTDVAIGTTQGLATITGTDHHPYWDVTTHAWTDANQLRVGDRLQTRGGATVTIRARRDYTAALVTYNLTVDTLHTYYVLAGNMPVLVHNSSCDLTNLTINDAHIVANHTPEGMFSNDTTKTEWLSETTSASRAAIIKDVLTRGSVVTDTMNRDGIVMEFTYEELIGYGRSPQRKPLYTMRVYFDPDSMYVRNAFPVE